MKRTMLLLLIVFSVFLTGVQAQDLTQEFDKVVNAYVKLDQFSGTILIAKDGKPIYSRACGEADKDHHVKNTLKTKFNIGSIGKTFTGTAIMQLAQAGKLDLDDPASKYLNGFPWGDKIKIRHLLSHTSGTFNYFAHPDFQNRISTIRSVGDALPLIFDQPLQFDEPGSKFFYSNSGIVLLGAIIEKVTGEKYADYISGHIHKPLGMNDTRINYQEEVVENRSTGYIKTASGKYRRNIFTVPPANADGGIETTAEDMLKFDQALYGDQIVGEEYKKKMFTPNLNDYGYCWQIFDRNGHKMIGHGGGAPGINAVFSRYVDDGYTLIVLSNYDNGASPIARTLEAILFGAPYEMPRPTLAVFLYEYMRQYGAKKLISEWDSILKENGYRIPGSVTLNEIGYELLGEKMTDEAITIFRQNIRLFPKEANPYDSLGEAYLAKGDSALAIDSYKKALEMDPGFPSAKAQLDRLMKQ